MPAIRDSRRIRGVRFVELESLADPRGRFQETFRKEWFPERTWDVVQANRSDSREGVLRGLHYHLRQVDYWIPLAGRLRIGLYDLRLGSPTRGEREVMELDASRPVGVFVPVGVAHGFLALTEATLFYLVDAYYDGSDERGIRWDDPEVGIDWGRADPVLSPRDTTNPALSALPENELPQF